jgi:lysophospholipase L1-like esterase
MWKNLVLLGCSSVLALVAVEVFLRIARPVAYRKPAEPIPEDAWRELLHRPSAVPGLAYELRPDAEEFAKGIWIRTNSLGLRDDEPLPGEGRPTVRLVAIGDSVTFGFGVGGDETYANVLERLLNSRFGSAGNRFEVLNCGVGGYAARDVAAVLEHRVLELRPDLVLYGYVLNDPETEPIQQLHSYFQEVEWWQRSHLLRLLAERRRYLRIRRFGGGNYLQYLHRDPDTWGSALAAFDRMRDASRGAEIPVVVVLFPILLLDDAGWSAYPYHQAHAQVAQAASARGFFVLDLLPLYEEYEPSTLRVSDTDGHPNATGHRLAAEALLALIAGEPSLLPAETLGAAGISQRASARPAN